MAIAENRAEGNGQAASRTTGMFAARATLPLYALTLFLSAFLLFSVQPFFAKMVLPRLGGSPAVWSVAMVFFQAMLLAGYAYAHLLTRYLSLNRAALVHGAVLILAFVVLPIAIPAGWDSPPAEGQALWLIGLFTVSVGLPFFAVSANGPLLQAWFARTGHAHAADPYFLYGSSNIGSFASLILYIVLIEPMTTVSGQSLMWTAGFALLAILVAGCALSAITGKADPAIEAPTSEASRPGEGAPAKWVLLGFVPSGLLVAVTAHISLDVAAAPFLWVAPLALFLLTFVIVFRRRPLVSMALVGRVVPILAAVALISIFSHNLLPVWAALAAHLAFYFAAALYCHGLLYEARPQASGLTGFYLWMSAGGVLGGIFASLLAPVLFDWVAEYILLIVAVLAIRPGFLALPRRALGLAVGVSLAGVAAAIWAPALGLEADIGAAGAVGAMIVVLVASGAAVQLVSLPVYLVPLALLPPLFFLHAELDRGVMRERSFFGVTRVLASDGGRFHLMMHGTTLHGAVDLTNTDARPEPLTYYHESGGIAAAVQAMQARRGGAMERAGAVGLGTGSVLCHGKPGEQWVAFEIDRAVADAAANPNYFPFMSECGQGVPVILGDARLTLADQPAGGFDLLLIDAFSSDSIPAHLMTREAVELYRSKLKPDGLLVFHISNRYLELQSVLAAIAEEEALEMRAGVFGKGKASAEDRYISANHVVVMAASDADFGRLADDERWKSAEPSETRAWTDDYSNIFAALLRKL